MAPPDLQAAVGKLITGKVAGPTLTHEYERLIVDGIMGGVTLFQENAQSLTQLCELVGAMHDCAGPGFLVAVDQEGGPVQRLHEVLTPLPSAMALASSGDTVKISALLGVVTKHLSWLGINCNLVPVLDVNSNPLNPIIGVRAFSDDPEIVAQWGKLVAREHRASQVLIAGKHFPGHGDTFEDSHLSLAVCNADKARLQSRELKPFADCLNRLPAILVGHVWLPSYEDSKLPASLSRRVIEGLLRKEMGFDGWVLCDDLPVMKAIVDNWGLAEASVLAVNAGVDNLLVSGSIDQIRSVHAALVKAVESDHIKEERVELALARRNRAMSATAPVPPKSDRASFQKAIATTQLQMLDTVFGIAADCVAVIRGRAPNMVPNQNEWLLVVPAHQRYPIKLSQALDGCGVKVEEVRYSLNATTQEIDQIVSRATGKRCLLLTYRALLNKEQLQLAERLRPVVAEPVVVATDVPYDLAALPAWDSALATFDPSELAMAGLARVLTGRAEPRGRCPVKLELPASFR